jgi:lipopolysaccharide export LptBFGC system permease protein LptF
VSVRRGWFDVVVDTLRFDRIDRYVVRYFFSSVFVVFVFFFGFFMVIDLFANADDFVETAKKIGIPARKMIALVAGYYLYKSPSVFLQVAPFVTVIGGMLRPVFVCAGGLTLFMLFVQEFVAPAASDHRLSHYSFLRRGEAFTEIRSQLTDAAGFHWASMRYDALGGVMKYASIVRIKGARVERVELKDARWDGPRRGWTMEGGVLQKTDDESGHHERSLDHFPTSLTPRQVAAQEKEPFDLSFAELGALLGITKQARFQVLLHYHVTFPLTNLLLLLLAIPFVLRYDRQHVMQGLAIAFFLCVAYFGVDSALRTLGEHRVHPILAAWFAPLFFGALGISLFDGVRS